MWNSKEKHGTYTKFRWYFKSQARYLFSLKWNGFTFHKRKQFPRNYYLSLFADRMLKSHSILYSSGWTQFSFSIRPPKTQSMWKFLCTQSISFSCCRRGPWKCGQKDSKWCNWRKPKIDLKNDSRSVIEGGCVNAWIWEGGQVTTAN